jgi:hypothetical protein
MTGRVYYCIIGEPIMIKKQRVLNGIQKRIEGLKNDLYRLGRIRAPAIAKLQYNERIDAMEWVKKKIEEMVSE